MAEFSLYELFWQRQVINVYIEYISVCGQLFSDVKTCVLVCELVVWCVHAFCTFMLSLLIIIAAKAVLCAVLKQWSSTV